MDRQRQGEPIGSGVGRAPALGRGYVQVYTGDGKGKTTAAVGLAVRAAAAGLRVFFGQFIKDGDSGEIGVLARAFPEITVRGFGRGQFVRGTPPPEDLRLARQGLAELRQALVSGEYALVIADEAHGAVAAGLLSVPDVLGLVEARPGHVELVFTGRNAPSALLAAADLVTEMRSVKHYFATGVGARQGIEH